MKQHRWRAIAVSPIIGSRAMWSFERCRCGLERLEVPTGPKGGIETFYRRTRGPGWFNWLLIRVAPECGGKR